MDRLQAPDLATLFPYDGNLHQFVSGPHGAAVLDVLIPPYNDNDRDCTYYKILPPHTMASTGPCRVAPCPMDDNFSCMSGIYRNAKWN
jgi:PCO_ADO